MGIQYPVSGHGGKVYWTNEAEQDGYCLQRLMWWHDHWRILDEDDFRVANSTESQMRAEFHCPTSPGSVYDHYGIYASDDCVYEYGVGDNLMEHADIHTTTMAAFSRGMGTRFVLEFPKRHGKPGKIDIEMHPFPSGQTIASLLSVVPNLWKVPEDVFTSPDYHFYTPEETIQRAKSRPGESDYNLVTNNCELFAIWCKTGIHESHQVKSLPGAMNRFHGKYLL